MKLYNFVIIVYGKFIIIVVIDLPSSSLLPQCNKFSLLLSLTSTVFCFYAIVV